MTEPGRGGAAPGGAAGGDFATTRWTLVLRAGERGKEEAAEALAELCEIYYEPVYAFVRRWLHGGDADRARDLTHAFFASLLGAGALGNPDPDRGRFRSFLLGAVKHFLARRAQAEGAQKRGGRAEVVGLEEAVQLPDRKGLGEAIPGALADGHFDRDWALAVVARALSRLEEEMRAAGKHGQFIRLRPWLDGAPAAGEGRLSDEPTGGGTGLSDNALRVAVHRLRKRFRLRVRSEVAATLRDPADLEGELRYLVEVLSGAGGP